jgi:hypothetical protein
LEQTVDYLKELEVPFEKVAVFSGGCAAQYKSRCTFAYQSLKYVNVERNYFGSEHGKSECDCELGYINRALDMALLGRKGTIANATEM